MTNSLTANYSFDWCRKDCTQCTQRGSASRYQMRLYALRVAMVLNGASVCHCGRSIDLHSGDVDRVVAGCYRPGTIVMTCRGCNNDRTNEPMFDSEALALDVARASLNVAVPSKSEASRAWNVKPVAGETLKASRYMR